MKNNLNLILVLFASIALVFISCRKNFEETAVAEDGASRFFSYNGNSPTVQSIINKLKNLESKKGFVNTLVRAAGYPLWEKTVVSSDKIKANDVRLRGLNEDTTYTYTPFTSDGDKTVQAVLISRTINDETDYKFLLVNDYLDYPKYREENYATATDVAKLFFHFEYSVFGHSTFKIRDPKNLFIVPEPDTYTSTVALRLQTCSQTTTNFYSVCTDIWYDPDGDADPCDCSGNEYYDHTECTYYSTTSIEFFACGGGSGGGGDAGGYPGGLEGGGGIHPFGTYPTTTPPPATTPTGWEIPPTDVNGFYYERYYELEEYIRQNSAALIPCEKLNTLKALSSFYQDLLPFTPDQVVKDRIQQLIHTPSLNLTEKNFHIQEIDDARSAIVNIDYFPLRITDMPSLTAGGPKLTPAEFLEYFRTHINDFITDPTITASFNPYIHGGIDDSPLWNSPQSGCRGALLSLKLPFDNGSVIVANYSSTATPNNHRWTFSTMKTPKDGMHPVSGNRRFGIFSDPTQGYCFYIGGIDRISNQITAIGNWLTGNYGFESSDKLWRNIIQSLINFITSHGGAANYYPTPDMAIRPNYAALKQYLEKKITLTELKTLLGC